MTNTSWTVFQCANPTSYHWIIFKWPTLPSRWICCNSPQIGIGDYPLFLLQAMQASNKVYHCQKIDQCECRLLWSTQVLPCSKGQLISCQHEQLINIAYLPQTNPCNVQSLMSYIKHAANMKHIQKVVSCWITISNWCCQCMTSFLFILPIVLHLFATLTTLTYERIPRHHQVALLLLWPSLGSLHSWKLHHKQPTCM